MVGGFNPGRRSEAVASGGLCKATVLLPAGGRRKEIFAENPLGFERFQEKR
jgi:hypothetical protein